jgi:hypothetical protein
MRGIGIENHEGMFGDLLPESGFAVTSRGGSSSSRIQTVMTRPTRCPGAAITPTALYFTPNPVCSELNVTTFVKCADPSVDDEDFTDALFGKERYGTRFVR